MKMPHIRTTSMVFSDLMKIIREISDQKGLTYHREEHYGTETISLVEYQDTQPADNPFDFQLEKWSKVYTLRIKSIEPLPIYELNPNPLESEETYNKVLEQFRNSVLTSIQR